MSNENEIHVDLQEVYEHIDAFIKPIFTKGKWTFTMFEEDFPIKVGKKGMTIVDMLAVIGQILTFFNEACPPKIHHDEEVGDFEISVFGDHMFPSTLVYDESTKKIKMYFDS